MNGPKRNLSRRLADAVDLMIDFATLGEYGLEPAATPAPVECRNGRRRHYQGRLPGHSRAARIAALRR